MITIDYKLNGRSIRPNQLGRELEKVVAKQFEDAVKKTASQIRCRTHGQYARVTVKRGHSVQGMSFEVSGCCDELAEEVRRRIC